jgi:hypothetical protein
MLSKLLMLFTLVMVAASGFGQDNKTSLPFCVSKSDIAKNEGKRSVVAGRLLPCCGSGQLTDSAPFQLLLNDGSIVFLGGEKERKIIMSEGMSYGSYCIVYGTVSSSYASFDAEAFNKENLALQEKGSIIPRHVSDESAKQIKLSPVIQNIEAVVPAIQYPSNEATAGTTVMISGKLKIGKNNSAMLITTGKVSPVQILLPLNITDLSTYKDHSFFAAGVLNKEGNHLSLRDIIGYGSYQLCANSNDLKQHEGDLVELKGKLVYDKDKHPAPQLILADGTRVYIKSTSFSDCYTSLKNKKVTLAGRVFYKEPSYQQHISAIAGSPFMEEVLFILKE